MAADELQPLKGSSGGATWYAYAYLTALLLAPVLALVGGVALGYIQPDITLRFDAQLGFVVEWLAAGLAVVFLFWTFVQVVRVTGIGFVRGVVGAVARIAHNYELPGEVPQPEQEDEQP